jgi:hypothetical protein
MVVVGGGGLLLIAAYSHTMDRFIPIAGSREFSAFLVSATAGSYAIELVYLALAVAAVGLLMRHGATWWQYVVVLVAIATPVLGFYGALHPGPHDSTNLTGSRRPDPQCRGACGRAPRRGAAGRERRLHAGAAGHGGVTR